VLLAENARFANADWGSKPQMIEVGHLSAEVRFWSLISGPLDIRAFELSDVTVLLEKQRDQANWMLSAPNAAEDETDAAPKSRTEFPLVIQKAQLRNVRLTYRSSGRADRVARLDALTITPGKAGLLGLEGSGKVDEYPITLKGEAGPIDSLLAGRDIRLKLAGRLGRLALDIDGTIGDLDPLDGANVKIRGTGEDMGAMLARFGLPVIATGALQIDAQLSDNGKRTQFAAIASVGDLEARARGALDGLYLRGSEFDFEIVAADAARLASVFDLHGLPASPLSVSGRVTPTKREIRFAAVRSKLADITAQVDGTFKRGRSPKVTLAFDVGVEDLAGWHEGLPHSNVAAKGNFAMDANKLEVTDLRAMLGGNPVNGSFSWLRSERRFMAELSSPRFDLTPLLTRQSQADASAPVGKSTPQSKGKLLFDDTPLRFPRAGTEIRLHVAVDDLVMANKTFHSIDGTALLDHDRIEFQARAKGSLEGVVQTSLTATLADPDGANINLQLHLENVRAGLDMKEMQPAEVPPLSVSIDLDSHGATARQMAENSNGYVLLTQGPGKTRAEFLNAFGGDMVSQLRTRLNPFRAQDPFTQLECTVLRAEVVDGMVTVTPVLVQTQKVTVAAQGKIDLHSEKLTFDFDTRPRKGIGVSPGMFTNPFIRIEGTLMNPRIAMGAKGMGSGAVAAATGGLSVLAGGFIDRIRGEANMCSRTLEKAMTAARKN